MAEFKLQEILDEIEKHLSEGTEAGAKMAILEANKVLDLILSNKNYPGRNLEQKLYWAGFSLKGKDDFIAALAKHKEVTEKLEVSISDFEAREIVNSYIRVIKVIAGRNKLNIADQMRNLFDMYFSPQSLLFWRNLAVFLGFFGIIKILAFTDLGKNVIESLIDWADFIIGWQFLVLVVAVTAVIWLVQNYFAGKSKVKIKEDIKINDHENRM